MGSSIDAEALHCAPQEGKPLADPRPEVRVDPSATWSAARPTSPPLFQTATFAQSTAVRFDGFDYTRSGNPTRALLEAELARLEHGVRGFAFGSGMGAIAATLSLLRQGDVLLLGDELYGGTVRYVERVLVPRGVQVLRVVADAESAACAGVARSAESRGVVNAATDAWRAAFARYGQSESRRVFGFLEVPTNPRLRVVDLEAIAAQSRAAGVALIVDNTALSPHWLNPLALGADVVVHSATKHLGGHGDLTAGAAIVADSVFGELFGDHLAFVQNAEGSGLAPFECWLLLRGMQTLEVRLEREGRTASAVAQFLESRPEAQVVHHPGLPSDPGHALLARFARGFGTLVSFTTGDAELSRRIVEATRQFTIAVSFGSVGSSVSLPCRMSHASIPSAADRPPSDLVRLSMGLESPDALIADLSDAFERASLGR